MRSIPDSPGPASMDESIVAQIDARLAGVETEHGVRIPWAIESGSRAWGFASPDSDYDCRFVYVRPAERYLTLWPVRDVIETPLDAVFDVNGWDLSKAIRLLVKGNATVVEWLQSPIVYSGDEDFRDRMLTLASRVIDPVLLQRHYLHVGRQQWVGGETAPLKKVFYALRPAASLRWLRLHGAGELPPMDLPTLLAECDPPASVVAEAEELTALKSVTRELGVGAVPRAIARFIVDEFELASPSDDAEVVPRAELAGIADEFFRAEVGG
jgi:uncharacterized protein